MKYVEPHPQGALIDGGGVLIGPAYYKFLDRDAVSRVLVDGTVLVSSFEHYRRLEASHGLIADPLEGASELTVPRPLVATENSPDLEMLNKSGLAEGLAQTFAHAATDGRILVDQGARFIRTMPGHVFCVGYGFFDDLRSEFNNYDACLRILSLRRLMRRIVRTGIIVESGRRFSDLFVAGEIGKVEYEARSRPLTEGPLFELSPFKKEIRFKSQQEVRIYFAPWDGESPPDRLIVRIDDPQSIFSEVRM
jgi:hypothetical protein